MLEQGKVREKSGEVSFRYRRANRSLYFGFGAKDKPIHLTDGSLRSFPMDTWSPIALPGKGT